LVSPELAGRHSQDAFPGPRGEHRHSQERAGISSPIEEQKSAFRRDALPGARGLLKATNFIKPNIFFVK